MKKLMGLFIVVFISIGLADLVQGIILTYIYTPETHAANSIEMANLLQYTISAITVTIVLWGAFKVKKVLKKALSVKV
ncbi:hypothetical protein [Bacillus sp. REN3]|uniref:hypothetical protein n=1 Tax=Bacillus sp. REN3 TaxID=2802440 RepID=UPI001AEE4003|nr:hypothetical protein [Bacillus sp. REN3]